MGPCNEKIDIFLVYKNKTKKPSNTKSIMTALVPWGTPYAWLRTNFCLKTHNWRTIPTVTMKCKEQEQMKCMLSVDDCKGQETTWHLIVSGRTLNLNCHQVIAWTKYMIQGLALFFFFFLTEIWFGQSCFCFSKSILLWYCTSTNWKSE